MKPLSEASGFVRRACCFKYSGALQCIDAFAAHHARVDATVNAVPILCLERARAAAQALASRPRPVRLYFKANPL